MALRHASERTYQRRGSWVRSAAGRGRRLAEVHDGARPRRRNGGRVPGRGLQPKERSRDHGSHVARATAWWCGVMLWVRLAALVVRMAQVREREPKGNQGRTQKHERVQSATTHRSPSSSPCRWHCVPQIPDKLKQLRGRLSTDSDQPPPALHRRPQTLSAPCNYYSLFQLQAHGVHERGGFMSAPEPMTHECGHGRVAGGVCVDCREPLAAVCQCCGGGRVLEREATLLPSAWARCGQPYPGTVA